MILLLFSLFPHLILSDADFSDLSHTIEVPANSQTFGVTQFYTIVDDDIDEDEQSFAFVVEIGPDVPENISCFQTQIGVAECHGRRGATEIRITDNDRELFTYGICHA